MFVCLSVLSHISKTTRPNFTKFSVRVTWVSGLRPSQCNMLCASGFVDDVMFSHNGANRPEAKRTRMFRPVRQVAAPVGRHTTLFGRVCYMAARGRSLPSPIASCLWRCFGVGALDSNDWSNQPYQYNCCSVKRNAHDKM